MAVIVLQYTVAMMGYGPEDKNAVLELTYNYGVTDYDKGNGYAQVNAFSFGSRIFVIYTFPNAVLFVIMQKEPKFLCF